MGRRARELSALRPRSPRRDEREGPAGAGQHQRRRAALAEAQSPPEPSPGRRERRRARAGAGDRASDQGGGGPEKAADRSGGSRSGPPRRVRVLLAVPGKCGRPSPRQCPGSVAAVVVVPGSGCAHPAAAPQAHRWLRGGRGCPRPRKELANSLRSGAQFPSPCFPDADCPRFRLGGGWRGGAGPAVGVDLQRDAPLPQPTH